ncbi:MAG: glycoside hydrolase family 30 protein [Spirochaetes bacterium]|nr:glycoside hydrolase family 30 protein [Spirochaetota bacterium]
MKHKIIISAKESGKRLYQETANTFNSSITGSLVEIDILKTYQKIIGFGGSFTEAGSTSLDKLTPEVRQEAIDAYFHPQKGINYTFCRTHIQSCDFSLGNYSYVEDPEDIELKTFTIERDTKSLIPLIRDALKTSHNNIRIFASPWSPPPFMKTNGQMNRGGSLKPEYYERWAMCFVKYLEEYQKEGISIWGVSIQNEPQAVTPWDNCVYSPEEERDFVKVLGPLLQREGLGKKKIIVWDHNKDIMKDRVDVMFADPEAIKWVWGVGFHWYSHSDQDNVLDNSILDYTHNNYGTNLVFTEGCNPLGNKDKPFLGEWWTGEKYGLNIINDLNHWTCAWCDWNMYLNEHGGPNHVNNFCDVSIIVDTKQNKIHYNSSYYYLAHFSRFIFPGAVRIYSSCSDDKLLTIAFRNTDDSLVIVVMNTTEDEKEFTLSIGSYMVSLVIEKRSIQTHILEDSF